MARPVYRLNDLAVRRANKAGLYADGGGLALRVAPGGSKSWVLRFMLKGTERTMGLGPYPTVTLAEARAKAADARKLLAERRDPIDARRAQRAATRPVVTFREATAEYIAAHEAGWGNAEHRRQWNATLEAYAFPTIGDVAVTAIMAAHVVDILRPIWTTKNETATRLRGRIESVLAYAADPDDTVWRNPAIMTAQLRKKLPRLPASKQPVHHPAMPYTALPAFLSELREQEGISARALEWTILTAARAGETAGATWSEIDLAGKVWTVPGARMKAGKEHRVPLCERALAILANGGNAGLLFTSERKRGNPLPRKAMRNALERMGRGDVTVHGFRSTFRDWAAECAAFPREVAEAALAHVTGSEVERAYARGDLFEKRRALMAEWAAFATGHIHK
jgi:integrase